MPTMSSNHHSALRSRLNNALINVINHRETNLIISALLIFLCLFIALRSLLVRFEVISRQMHEFNSSVNSDFLTFSPSAYNFDQLLNRSPAETASADHLSESDHIHRQASSLSPDHELETIGPVVTLATDQAQLLSSDHDEFYQSTLASDYDQEEQPFDQDQLTDQSPIPPFADQAPRTVKRAADQDHLSDFSPDHNHRPVPDQNHRPVPDQDYPSDFLPDQNHRPLPNNKQPMADHDHRSVPDQDHHLSRPTVVSSSLISLFILLSLSLLLGRLLSYFFIPSITGPILIGILFTNLFAFRSLFHYFPHYQLSTLIYEIAFLLIIIRSAFGIDQSTVRQFYTLCFGIGFVCPLFECLIIVLASHFLFHLPLGASILFGFALCASSLAVISPIILRLRKEQRGTDSGLDSIVLTSTSFDNIVALTGFLITFGVLSPRADALIYTLTRLPAELLIGSIFGILVGLLLRAFPRADASSAHFVRTLLISAFALAAHFGAQTIGCVLFGPITALFATAVAKMRWHTDNDRNTRLEENAFRLAWDLLIGQLLFLHLGMLVNISLFAWPMVGRALAVLALSIASRFVATMFCALLCFNNISQVPSSSSSSSEEEYGGGTDRYRRRLFLAIATVPKASVQCQLLPLIVQLFLDHRYVLDVVHGGHRHGHRHSVPDGTSLPLLLPVHVCLVAVLTVPFSHLLVRRLGKMLLRPKLSSLLLLSSSGGGVGTKHLAKKTTTASAGTRTIKPKLLGITNKSGAEDDNWGKVTQSDPKDNRLKLEVGRSDENLTNRQMRQQQLRL
ncbi:hypothetical protein niasHT_027462 [Heterodera trifolii]|uniref:Cation/H+ exchanger domain-containing protein n=1 Tax=Heterodera trifolii TaxID=157864 RepID=A0ABD2JMN0_9BILA